MVEEASWRHDRAAVAGVCRLPRERDDSSWRFQRGQVASCGSPCESVPSDSFYPGHLCLLRVARSPLESVSTKPGSIAFRNDLPDDPGRLPARVSPLPPPPPPPP